MSRTLTDDFDRNEMVEFDPMHPQQTLVLGGVIHVNGLVALRAAGIRELEAFRTRPLGHVEFRTCSSTPLT